VESTTTTKIIDKKEILHLILTNNDETEIFNYIEFPFWKPSLNEEAA